MTAWLLPGLFRATRRVAGHFNLHQRQTRMIEKYPSGRSERNAAGLALQQLYAGLQFEIVNLPA